ncbi:MAG: hypothetical protein KAI24_18425 [Planctomycetes bacterium]|nr:hypothetical protein [Planctomycetota bacterium]
MSAGAVAQKVPLRTRRRALAIAAGTLWLPCLLPIVLGLLRDCSHCMHTFLAMFLMVPGVIVPVLLRLEDVWFGEAGAAVTLAVFAGLYAAARELPTRWLYALQVVAMLLIGLEAVGLAMALRA